MRQPGPLANFFWVHIHRSDASVSWRWAAAIFVMLAIFPGIGSAGTGMLISLWVVCLIYCGLDPDLRQLNGKETRIAVICAAYFLIMAAIAFYHALQPGQTSGYGSVYSNLPFLCLAPLLPVWRRAVRPGWTQAVFAGIACGGILAALIITIGGHYSPEILRAGFSGNDLILALGALVCSLLCVHSMLFYKGSMRWLMATGALAALYVLFMSGSRGPLLAYCATLAVYALVMGYRYFGLGFMFKRAVIGALIIAASGIIAAKYDPDFSRRINLAIERFENPSDTQIAEKSISARFMLYRLGFDTFAKQPLIGYGRQNVIQAVKESAPQYADRISYTHLHNGYLTEAVASGLAGLLSLLAVLLGPVFLLRNAPPIVFGGMLCVSLAYIFYGTSNLLFYHDVSNSLYLAMIGVFFALSNLEEEAR